MPKYQGQSFSCVNPRGRFHTDIGGQRRPSYPHHHPHHPSTTLGSALPTPLWVDPNDGGSLWLEHVIDTHGGWDPFWFMWYDAHGNPRLTMSGTFDLPALRTISESLAVFVKGHD
jgi:hypothetical protein